MDEFANKVALITGAGRGSGREIAVAFSSSGSAVAANDINPLAVDETVNRILRAGGNARAHVFDIAKRMPIEGLLAQVLEHFGRIDFLVNYASVQPDASLLEMDEWEFHRTLDVNLAGPFFMIQQVGRAMRESGGGAIVNVVTTAKPGQFKKGHAAHLASQAGLLGLTQAAADELAADHIRVNAVCYGAALPSLVDPSTNAIDTFRTWQKGHPALWTGAYSELVSMVLYLCSAASADINGQIVTIDDGK